MKMQPLRAVQEPPGLYIRPGHNDHKVLCQLISENKVRMSGVVFDPSLLGPQAELHEEIQRRRLDAVLDPRFLELATPVGHTKKRIELPWAMKRYHRLGDLVGKGGVAVAEQLADFVVKNKFSAVIAPTHYLALGANDPWLLIDRELATVLRAALDSRNARDVAIYYTLSLPSSAFYDQSHRALLKSTLAGIPVDAIWLKVHPFGNHAGHVTLQRYILACWDFQKMAVPLVAQRTGNVGLALLAFNAVGGLEAGVSSGDRFDYLRLLRDPGDKKGFAAHPRVYMGDLGLFLTRPLATELFKHHTFRNHFGCRNTDCCAHGAQDMVRDARRHFLISRTNEVAWLGNMPEAVRAGKYLEDWLRPATDRLGRVAQWDINETLLEKLEQQRKRLNGWRATLGEMEKLGQIGEHSIVPLRRAVRQHRGGISPSSPL